MRKPNRSKEQLRAVRQVLVQMFQVLFLSEMTEHEVLVCIEECMKLAKQKMSAPLDVSSKVNDQDFGSVLRTWHRQAHYLSKDGFPRPLKLNGKYGLKALVGKYFPKSEIEVRLAALKAAGLVRENRQKSWVPTGKYALFPQLNGAVLGHISEGVSRLVETVIGNVTASDKEGVLFERSAKVRRFPVTAAQSYREFVNAQAIAFLATVDDWLESQEDKAKNKRVRKCTAGVFTFAFMDDVSKTRRRSNSR